MKKTQFQYLVVEVEESEGYRTFPGKISRVGNGKKKKNT